MTLALAFDPGSFSVQAFSPAGWAIEAPAPPVIQPGGGTFTDAPWRDIPFLPVRPRRPRKKRQEELVFLGH